LLFLTMFWLKTTKLKVNKVSEKTYIYF